MVIETKMTLEEMKARTRALMEDVKKANVMNNPKYQDPKGITFFCGTKYQKTPQKTYKTA